jgi:hypothetical protein
MKAIVLTLLCRPVSVCVYSPVYCQMTALLHISQKCGPFLVCALYDQIHVCHDNLC